MFIVDLMLSITLIASGAYRIVLDWRSSRLVSPLSAVTGLIILLFYAPAFFLSKEISIIIVVGSITLVFLNILNPRPFRKPIAFVKFKNRQTVKLFFKAVFLCHLIISAALASQIILEFGIVGGLVRDRLDGYLLNIGGINILNSVWFVTQFGYYFYLSRIFVTNRVCAIILSIFYLVCLIYFANTRLSLLLPIGVMLAFYVWIFQLRFKVIFLISISLLLIMPSFLVYSNAARQGIDLKNINYNLYEFLIHQIDYNEYIDEIEMYYSSPTQNYELGYGWFLASAVNVVPRVFYNDKPITSFSNRLTIKVTGQKISFLNPVRTYTILGTGYSQFGLIGTLIEVVFYLYIFSRLYYTAMDHLHLKFFGFYIAIFSLLYFRGETPYVQCLIIYLTVLSGADACKTTSTNT